MSDTTIDEIEWGKLLIPVIQPILPNAESVEEAEEWCRGTNGTWFKQGEVYWSVEIDPTLIKSALYELMLGVIGEDEPLEHHSSLDDVLAASQNVLRAIQRTKLTNLMGDM